MCDILLVEDNALFRRTLYESLATRYPDAAIEAVASGEEALQRCERLWPRIIFLDLLLPGINGLQVMEAIRSENTDVFIVVITGNDDAEYKEAAESKGADFFMSKNTLRLGEVLNLTAALIGADGAHGDITEKFRISTRT
jgi:CheY-like chemotaxis protein